MSDIVERLRAHGSKTEMKAAEEIERLRALAPDLVKQNGVLAKEIERLQAKVDRLMGRKPIYWD